MTTLAAAEVLATGWPERVADAASDSYPILVVAVLLGAIVPVIPTGAAVSAAAVLAVHEGHLSLLVVVVLSAVSAWLGDCVVYALFRWGRRGAVRLVDRNLPSISDATPEGRRRLVDSRQRLTQHGTSVLVVSRLIPGGRLPTLLAASAIRYPWPRYLCGAAAAAGVWAVAYALMGLVGGSLFADPLVGVAVTVGATLLVSLIARSGQRWLATRGPGSGAGGQPSAEPCAGVPGPAG